MKKREVVLTEEQVRAMFQQAKLSSERDYLMLGLMANCGLRRAELVGGDDSRVPEDKRLPGLRAENFRDGGCYVLGKKADQEVFVPIPPALLTEIHAFLQHKSCEKCGIMIVRHNPADGHPFSGTLFDYSTDGVYKLCRKYAKLARVPDWDRVHPHRLRHFFITRVARQTGRDTFKTRDLARHKNVATTSRYVAELSPREKSEIAETIAIV